MESASLLLQGRPLIRVAEASIENRIGYRTTKETQVSAFNDPQAVTQGFTLTPESGRPL